MHTRFDGSTEGKRRLGRSAWGEYSNRSEPRYGAVK
jgi:hypothetical protein